MTRFRGAPPFSTWCVWLGLAFMEEARTTGLWRQNYCYSFGGSGGGNCPLIGPEHQKQVAWGPSRHPGK